MIAKSVADIEGPWRDPDFESGLIARCKQFWSVPIHDLPDAMIVTYLNQGFAQTILRAEAERRIASNTIDGSELFDGQMAEALERSKKSSD